MSQGRLVDSGKLLAVYERVQPVLIGVPLDEVILGALFVIYAAQFPPGNAADAEKWAGDALAFVGTWAPQVAPSWGFQSLDMHPTVQ